MPSSVALRTSAPGSLNEAWLTVAEVIRHWPVSRATVYGAIARGELRAAHIGAGKRRIVIRGSWVNDWLEAAAPVEIRR